MPSRELAMITKLTTMLWPTMQASFGQSLVRDLKNREKQDTRYLNIHIGSQSETSRIAWHSQ